MKVAFLATVSRPSKGLICFLSTLNTKKFVEKRIELFVYLFTIFTLETLWSLLCYPTDWQHDMKKKIQLP